MSFGLQTNPLIGRVEEEGFRGRELILHIGWKGEKKKKYNFKK